MKLIFLLIILLCLTGNRVLAQNVTVTVNAAHNKRAVSPFIYGRNNTFDQPVSFYEDVGLRFARMNGGNNATRYNWRKKITCHPDWYNNVYSVDWDAMAQNIETNHPNMQGMFAFQLLGRVAFSTEHNFDDWSFNQSQYWEGHGQNLAGGGVPNTEDPNGKALVEGDVDLYTQVWPSDSSVAILDHWFGPDGLGLNKDQFRYWSMDNEPDIWNGTHDDVMSSGLISASEFMDRFIDLAKKARYKFPEIKICGPVTTSEWQWYKWGDESIEIDGQYYCWLEYFIKRCAEEEKATGIRVLDVVDIHHYPYYPSDEAALQIHRTYYDEAYDYPGANGLKTINGGWDNSHSKEYIFKRIDDWLDQHFGPDHHITLGLSEWSPGPSNPNLASVIYASHLGVFGENGVEFFSPWSWFEGMWETLHLFSRYAKSYSVSSTSSLENIVSAYTTVNESADSMTVIIVNREMNSAQNVTVDLNELSIPDGSYKTLQLASLPDEETFVSHTQNALMENSVSVRSNTFTMSVPALSTTAILLTGSTATSVAEHSLQIPTINVSYGKSFLNISLTLLGQDAATAHIYNLNGAVVKKTQLSSGSGKSCSAVIDVSGMSKGFYLLKIGNKESTIYSSKFLLAN